MVSVLLVELGWWLFLTVEDKKNWRISGNRLFLIKFINQKLFYIIRLVHKVKESVSIFG